VAPGQTLTYLLSFGNRTAGTLAPDAMLSLLLPAGVDFVSASDGGLLNAAGGDGGMDAGPPQSGTDRQPYVDRAR